MAADIIIVGVDHYRHGRYRHPSAKPAAAAAAVCQEMDIPEK